MVYKINLTHKWKFILGKIEKIVGKGENAGNQHCLLFLLNVFKGFCLGTSEMFSSKKGLLSERFYFNKTTC